MTADVVGYSRLIGADEEGTIVALEALRADLNDPKLMEHQGRAVADEDAGKGCHRSSPAPLLELFADLCVHRELAGTVQEDAEGDHRPQEFVLVAAIEREEAF